MTNVVGKTLKAKFNSVVVEEDAITISYRALYHGYKGDKRIPYTSITSVQFREPGNWLAGYIQFSIKGGIEWHGPVNQDENAVVFDGPIDDFRSLRDLVQSKMGTSSGAGGSVSVADELGKLAVLLEQGTLTEQEFAAQKAKLLGG